MEQTGTVSVEPAHDIIAHYCNDTWRSTPVSTATGTGQPLSNSYKTDNQDGQRPTRRPFAVMTSPVVDTAATPEARP